MRNKQWWTAVALMAAGVLSIRLRGDVDHVPPSAPLTTLPKSIATWNSTELPLDEATLEVLGKGEFLHRMYVPSTPDPPITLFIGYFPTQRTGQAIHSPQNCLPGSGWTFEASGQTHMQDATGRTYNVGDYLIANGTDKQEVFYWYQTHGRSIASDYKAKWYMLTDSMRYARTDAALIRVTTVLARNETRDAARQRVISFTRQFTPMLSKYVPD